MKIDRDVHARAAGVYEELSGDQLSTVAMLAVALQAERLWERERCAKLCEERAALHDKYTEAWGELRLAAREIREGGT